MMEDLDVSEKSVNREEIFVPHEGADAANAGRVDAIKAHFKSLFDVAPQFIIRVPGRVNLIGEHIDYCGYAVLPMAIEHNVIVAGRLFKNSSSNSGPTIRIANVDPVYPEVELALAEIRSALDNRKAGTAPAWHLYFLCGLRGVLQEFDLDGTEFSLQVIVDGRVPPRAGLSSSSAMVCAATLASLSAFKINVSKRDIADLSAKSERFIGTQGGGMDQAIAMLATSGCAQYIEFTPSLKATSVNLPLGAVFVVANSLAEANKAANDSYNYRVTECRLATWILAKKKGVDFQALRKPIDLQLLLKVTLDELLLFVDETLHKEPYTVQEVCTILDTDENYLRAKTAITDTFDSSLVFKLRQRIQHVFSEAGRVQTFKEVCNEKEADAGDSNSNLLPTLGKLMNLSHQSLKELYECSHPQLDQLVQLAQGVSHGARLTGAGWGGCMIALVDRRQLQQLLSKITAEYYERHFGITDIKPHVFITEPSQGATIIAN